jgi:phosphonate metabolism-associated iron-containing alcohol dehydrogenase
MLAQTMWSYRNPVDVSFGIGSISTLPSYLARRSYALVTYPDEPFKILRDRIQGLVGPPALVIDNVKPNPDFVSLAEAAEVWANRDRQVDVIVAVGGGSAMDSAKVLSAAGGGFSRVHDALLAGQKLSGTVPIIAVPTTAGTGSEVTMWATVWDTRQQKKYSLASPTLYAEAALVDPELTVAMPRSLTVSTGLDALSHALESIWNRNANPVSTELAVAAAREILTTLPAVLDDLPNLELRARMSRAALLAGLAFSNTKTALAHSLSYPITLEYGVPHGIACSFTLPLVMRSAVDQDADCDAALRRIFGGDLGAGAEQLDHVLHELGVSTDPSDYGVRPARWRDIVRNALVGERGLNFIGKPERVFTAVGVDASA